MESKLCFHYSYLQTNVTQLNGDYDLQYDIQRSSLGSDGIMSGGSALIKHESLNPSADVNAKIAGLFSVAEGICIFDKINLRPLICFLSRSSDNDNKKVFKVNLR